MIFQRGKGRKKNSQEENSARLHHDNFLSREKTMAQEKKIHLYVNERIMADILMMEGKIILNV